MSFDYPPLGNGTYPPYLTSDSYFSDAVFTQNLQVDGTGIYTVLTSSTTGNLYVSGSTSFPGGISGPAADFFALMPGDNSATIAGGTPVLFPQNGPTNGPYITSNGPQVGTFTLANVGTYQVKFQASVTEPGQLVVVLNNVQQTSTQVGRSTGSCQIVGNSLVTTTVPNTVLSINNPSGNTPALTLTPTAGGTHSVSAHLVIKQLF